MVDGYKQMVEGDIRYYQVLLDMIASVGSATVAARYFALFGYSGGGQFTHRFCYLHPEKLWGGVHRRTGSVTLLDADQDCCVRVRTLPRALTTIEPASLQRFARAYGGGDSEPRNLGITHREGGNTSWPGANAAGRTRPERPWLP